LSGRDLVVLPLLHEAQHHRFALQRTQKIHPVTEFEGRTTGGFMAGSGGYIVDVLDIHDWNLAHALGVVPVRGVAGHLEEPGAEQLAIPNLPGSTVDREHHFLRQIFGDTGLVSAPPEERNQLWRDNSEESIERVFVRLVQESLDNLTRPRLRCEFL
jgi:hypothetical protein